MNSTGAVITADIVNSSLIGKKSFSQLTRKLKALINSEKGKFLFYRGDSFQCYLADMKPAFSLALRLRTATLRYGSASSDLRVSAGFGAIDTPVQRLNEATGAAFVISGRELDSLEDSGRRLIMKSENAQINVALDTISMFTDYLFAGMTDKQADVLRYLLEGKTQHQIARSLRKSQSTVNRHARALGWKEFEYLLDKFSGCIEMISR